MRSSAGPALALALVVAMGAGGLTRVEAKCPIPDALDPHPCATCVAANGQEAGEMCAWCYTSKKCLPMTGLGQPCPEDADFSLFGGDCDCRPSENTNCASCTKQLGCVWINEGQKNWTISVAGVTFPSFATNINQSCVSGSAVGPLLPAAGYEVANLITVTMEPDVRKWCWGQCTIPGVWFALAVGLGAVAGTALLLSVTRSVFCAAYRGCRPRAPAPAAVRVTVDLAAEDGRGGYYPLEGGDAGAAAAREARTNGRQAMRG